jgi:protein-S-isoprenylcysteine O-methyltransferase Ste14
MAGCLVSLAVGGGMVVRKNPAAINERGRQSADTKGWDKAILGFYAPLSFAVFVLAGLDAGRYGWSSLPLWLQAVGAVGLVPAMIVPYWAMLANPVLATTLRIQQDRGHRVATTGPCRYVRHPMYVGMVLLQISTCLFLGS